MKQNHTSDKQSNGQISSTDGYGNIFESLPEFLVVFNAELIAVQANAPARMELGIDPVGLHSRQIAERISSHAADDTALPLSEIISQAVRNENPVIGRAIVYRDSNGTPKSALCTVTPLHTDDAISGAVLVFSAPGDGHRTDSFALDERNRLLRILDSIEDGIYICGSDFRVEYANPALLKEFGEPAEKQCFEYLYNRDSRCPWCRGDEVFGGKTIHWEWKDTKTGRIFDIVDTPLDNPDGSLSKLKIFHDITERKAEEARLVSSKEILETRVETINTELEKTNILLSEKLADLKVRDSQLRAQGEVLEKIFSNTTLLIAFLDTGFDFIRVNNAWSEIDGRAPDFFPGKNYFALYPDKANETIFSDVVANASPFVVYAKPFSFSGYKAPGSAFWDWSLQPVIGENGMTEGLILTLIDVTKKTKAEKELLEAEAALSEAKRLSDIGTLAATVAHELRNPLGVIQAAVYNIKKKAREEALVSHISNIEKKIGESERIINNLLNYSNIKQPKLKKIHLYFFICECLETIEDLYKDCSVALKRNFENLRDIMIEIDPFQIREVLINILNNAYQALMEKEGTIEFEGSLLAGDRVSILISDNGEGIESEDMNKIFVPFFTRKSKGTGLGLTICQELVKLHGGEIELSSEIGKGTSVHITLPRGFRVKGTFDSNSMVEPPDDPPPQIQTP